MEKETFAIPIWISYGRTERSSNNKYGLYTTEDSSKSKESIFDRVKNILHEENINVKSDKDLTWGDNLDDFEKKFKDAKIVIVILNDKYLTSEHCMNEWKNIHESDTFYRKKVFYIKYNEEIIKTKDNEVVCDRGFDLNNTEYRTLLYEYWIQFFKNNYSNPSKDTIVEKALKNGCYFDEINQIHTIISNEYSVRSGSDNFTDVIREKIKEYKSNHNATYYNSIIYSILVNNPILIVGDSVLEYNNDNLGNQLNIELERWLRKEKGEEFKDIREWNRNKYKSDIGIEEHAYDTIQKYSNTPACSETFELFLEKANTNIIISFGYSKQIYYAVRRYVEKKYGETERERRLLYISLQDKDFATKCKIDKNVRDYIVFIDLVKDITNNLSDTNSIVSQKRMVYCEKDIVDLISNTIIAIRNVDFIKNKSVLAIGTNIPGWGLRFLWNALNHGGNRANHPTLSNRIIDSKSYNYINKRFTNQRMIDEEDLFILMKRFGESNDTDINNENTKKIYVFYYDEEYDDDLCKILYEQIMPITEKLNVSMYRRKTFSKDRINENIELITKAEFVIICYTKPDIYKSADIQKRSVYQKEIKAIKQKANDNIFIIYADTDAFVGIKSNYTINRNDDVHGTLWSFLTKHNVEQVTKKEE